MGELKELITLLPNILVIRSFGSPLPNNNNAQTESVALYCKDIDVIYYSTQDFFHYLASKIIFVVFVSSSTMTIFALLNPNREWLPSLLYVAVKTWTLLNLVWCKRFPVVIWKRWANPDASKTTKTNKDKYQEKFQAINCMK